MAIVRSEYMSFRIYGDGSSSEFALDLHTLAPAMVVNNVLPTSVLTINVDVGSISGSLDGHLLRLTFSPAPPASDVTVSVRFGYSGS